MNKLRYLGTYEKWELPDGSVITGVHLTDDCQDWPCVIHSPTDHHMRDGHLFWRGDRGIFERICEHGVGHPDPDQFKYWDETGQESQSVHGCDGCCVE